MNHSDTELGGGGVEFLLTTFFRQFCGCLGVPRRKTIQEIFHGSQKVGAGTISDQMTDGVSTYDTISLWLALVVIHVRRKHHRFSELLVIET